MTCSSIGDFVDYMVDFYQQRDRRKIVSTIDNYGDDELDPYKLQGLRDREPAFDALRVKPKLFSDMYVFERFLNDRFAHSRTGGGGGGGEEEKGHIPLGSVAKQSSTGIAKTPQATTLPLKVKVKQGVEEEVRGETTLLGAAVDDDTISATTTTTILPPYVYYWNSSVQKYSNYFTLMVNMRYVTQVPHSRAWLCLNQALFDEHFKINVTSQLARMNGEGGSFEPFAGAHFQGDCKSKMMQLLYGDVIKAIEEMPDM